MATRRTPLLMGGSITFLAVAAFGFAHWLSAKSDGSKGARLEPLASAAASAGCADATCAAQDAVDNDVKAPFLTQFAARTEYLYRLAYSVKGSTAAGQDLYELQLDAELSLTRIQDGDEQLLQLQLSRVTSSKGELAPELAALLQQASVPIYGRYLKDGELSSVHAPTDIDAGVLTLLTYLLADLQLQAPRDAARTWEADESDPTGIYSAVYQRKPGRQISRAHRRYLSLHQPSSAALEQLSHVSTFGFSAAGLLDRFDSRARIMQRTEQAVLQGLTDVNLRYSSSRPSSLTQLPAHLAVFPVKGRGSSPSSRSDPQTPAAQLASSLRTTVGDTEGHFLEKQTLADRIRQHPSEIGDVLAAVHSALDGYESARLIAALTMAGTPEATKAVADLARDNRLDPKVRDQAVTELSITDSPTADSVRELSQLADDVTVDDGTRKAALLGVGANLRSASVDVVTAEQRTPLTARLEDQAQRAPSPEARQTALAALGNVGSAAHFDAIAAGLSSPNPADRAAAVFALRHIQTPEAERAILKALARDPDPGVRADAAGALASRNPRTELAASSLLAALEREQDPGVQRVLVPALGIYLPTFPELRPGLKALEESTKNQELKRHLGALLNDPAQGSSPSL